MGLKKFGFDKASKGGGSGISDEDMIFDLSYIGEQMCNHAREITIGHSSGGYDDQTCNLRSSIGYRILKDGIAVKDSGFKTIQNETGRGEKGENAARKALEAFSIEASVNGWTLIVVAGMDYAKYVEDRGFNVLHLTDIALQEEIRKLREKRGL